MHIAENGSSRGKIFVVDDEPAFAVLLAAGYKVICFADRMRTLHPARRACHRQIRPRYPERVARRGLSGADRGAPVAVVARALVAARAGPDC